MNPFKKALDRRDVLKLGAAGAATLIIGGTGTSFLEKAGYAESIPSWSGPTQTVQTLNFTITDTIKEMVTHEPGNNEALCYFWCFKEQNQVWADCPGPNIFATVGQPIEITVTNALDEPHAFFIPRMVSTGPIAPGDTVTVNFTASKAGTYLYYDNLNAPVNRVMGLHGAFIVMPAGPVSGHKWTPYDRPSPAVQQLFDDFGSTPWFPGIAWQDGVASNPARPDGSIPPPTPPFRQWIWVLGQASSKLFAEVGSLPAGDLYSPRMFLQKFTRDRFVACGNDGRADCTTTERNYKPEYFTIGGQSGHFAHNFPEFCPNAYIGDPGVIRVLNPGVKTHSMHIHANHMYVLAVNNIPRPSLWWVDTYTAHPLDTFDWGVPFMRPPDIPNVRGVGRADAGLPTVRGGSTYPPLEELDVFMPPQGSVAKAPDGSLCSLAIRQSPLCFPMHDHSEASQTAQGGNYNCGLISGIIFLGDRNNPPGGSTFPGAFPG